MKQCLGTSPFERITNKNDIKITVPSKRIEQITNSKRATRLHCLKGTFTKERIITDYTQNKSRKTEQTDSLVYCILQAFSIITYTSSLLFDRIRSSNNWFIRA